MDRFDIALGVRPPPEPEPKSNPPKDLQGLTGYKGEPGVFYNLTGIGIGSNWAGLTGIGSYNWGMGQSVTVPLESASDNSVYIMTAPSPSNVLTISGNASVSGTLSASNFTVTDSSSSNMNLATKHDVDAAMRKIFDEFKSLKTFLPLLWALLMIIISLAVIVGVKK